MPRKSKGVHGTTGLRQYGPWKEITKAQARAMPETHVLTIVEGDDGDTWCASTGFHWVNDLMFFKSAKSLPADLVIDDVWLDENGNPVTNDE